MGSRNGPRAYFKEEDDLNADELVVQTSSTQSGTQFTVLLSTSWRTKCRVDFSIYLSTPGSSGSRVEMAMVVLCFQSCNHYSSCCP